MIEFSGRVREILSPDYMLGMLRAIPEQMPPFVQRKVPACSPNSSPPTFHAFLCWPGSIAALQTQRACSDVKPLPLSFLCLDLLSSKSPSRVAFPIKMALHSLPNYSNTLFTLLGFIHSTYPNLTHCIFTSAFYSFDL